VTELHQFFLDDNIFIAFGSDRSSPDDFLISDVGERLLFCVRLWFFWCAASFFPAVVGQWAEFNYAPPVAESAGLAQS